MTPLLRNSEALNLVLRVVRVRERHARRDQEREHLGFLRIEFLVHKLPNLREEAPGDLRARFHA